MDTSWLEYCATDAQVSESDADERYARLKDEHMPDSRMKRIFRDHHTGKLLREED